MYCKSPVNGKTSTTRIRVHYSVLYYHTKYFNFKNIFKCMYVYITALLHHQMDISRGGLESISRPASSERTRVGSRVSTASLAEGGRINRASPTSLEVLSSDTIEEQVKLRQANNQNHDTLYIFTYKEFFLGLVALNVLKLKICRKNVCIVDSRTFSSSSLVKVAGKGVLKTAQINKTEKVQESETPMLPSAAPSPWKQMVQM